MQTSPVRPWTDAADFPRPVKFALQKRTIGFADAGNRTPGLAPVRACSHSLNYVCLQGVLRDCYIFVSQPPAKRKTTPLGSEYTIYSHAVLETGRRRVHVGHDTPAAMGDAAPPRCARGGSQRRPMVVVDFERQDAPRGRPVLGTHAHVASVRPVPPHRGTQLRQGLVYRRRPVRAAGLVSTCSTLEMVGLRYIPCPMTFLRGPGAPPADRHCTGIDDIF